jgi:CspA family cold shock protein
MIAHTHFDIDAVLNSLDGIEYGVVRWFNNDYGFGFITPDDGGPDIFVHISEIDGASALWGGERVSYRIGGPPEKPEAQIVHVL